MGSLEDLGDGRLSTSKWDPCSDVGLRLSPWAAIVHLGVVFSPVCAG